MVQYLCSIYKALGSVLSTANNNINNIHTQPWMPVKLEFRKKILSLCSKHVLPPNMSTEQRVVGLVVPGRSLSSKVLPSCCIPTLQNELPVPPEDKIALNLSFCHFPIAL